METETRDLESLIRPAGLILRTGGTVLAIILLILAAATIGVINNNEELVSVLIDETPSDPDRDLQLLARNTLGSAGWLIFMAVGVAIAEIIAIVLQITNVQTGRLVLDVLEIVFSFIVAFCYFSTGIACALYASAWGQPPERCRNREDLDCKEMALTATNALQTVFCFFQLAIFILVGVLIIFNLIKKRKT